MSNSRPFPKGRIELPENWEPEGIVCALVPCPDDPQFYSMLVGLIDRLVWSAEYERDDTGEGAGTVARTWSRALTDRPIEFMECDEMQFELRDDPDNPCAVQQSLDGGASWIHAFNKEDCEGPIVNPAPLPGNPEAAEAAAGNALRNIYIALLEMIGDCTLTRTEFIEQATAYLRLGDAAYSNPIALGALYDAYCALDPTDRETALSECSYLDEHSELTSCYDNAGLIDDLNCLSETISEWLNGTSAELGISLASVAAAMGFPGWQSFSNGSFTGGTSGAGGGGSFGSECGWCHEFDYTSGEFDTFPHATLQLNFDTEYDSGVGYKNGVTDPNQNMQYNFDMAYNITFMEIEFTSDNTEEDGNRRARINSQHGTFAGNPFNPYDSFPYENLITEGGGNIQAGHAPIATNYVQTELVGYTAPFGASWGTIVVTRWKICGTGPDPFV